MDALSVTNIKLFLVQDRVNKAADGNTPLSAEDTKLLVDLNRRRNRLMAAVEECLDASIKAGHADVDSRPKL